MASNDKRPDDWERKVFQSSHLHSGAYSPSRRTLVIRFGPDARAFSGQIPPTVWDSLKQAQSPGIYYSQNIRPNFIFERFAKADGENTSDTPKKDKEE